MKRLLNEQQQQAIASAVVAAEKNTRAEIVTVLAPASDNYRIYGLLWSLLIALLLAAVTSAVLSASHLAWSPPAWLPMLPAFAVVLSVALALLLQLPVLLRLVVPKHIQRQRAAMLARVQFLAQNLHHTRGETGVLIFVSEFERYVEVLVDRGVAQHVPDSTWQQVIDELTAQVKAGDVEAGFIGAINRCGKLLAGPLPPDSDNPNELPNRLVVLQ